MSAMQLRQIEDELSRLLAAARGWIPSEQLDDMEDLVRAGEPGVALENFSTQLYEYDIEVPTEMLDRIAVLGKAMNLDPSYWELLEKK